MSAVSAQWNKGEAWNRWRECRSSCVQGCWRIWFPYPDLGKNQARRIQGTSQTHGQESSHLHIIGELSIGTALVTLWRLTKVALKILNQDSGLLWAPYLLPLKAYCRIHVQKLSTHTQRQIGSGTARSPCTVLFPHSNSHSYDPWYMIWCWNYDAIGYQCFVLWLDFHRQFHTQCAEKCSTWEFGYVVFVSVSVATINPPALVSAKGRVFQETLTRLALPPRKRWACYARKRMVGLKTLQVTGLLPSVGVRTYVVTMPR